MTTNMEDALKKAGVRTPTQFERVWLWLQTHPGKTGFEIAVGVGLTQAGLVSTILSQLENRRMVVSTLEYRRNVRGASRHYIKCWKTAPNLKEYILLSKNPKPATTNPKKNKSVPLQAAIPAPMQAAIPASAPAVPSQVSIPTDVVWPNTDLNIAPLAQVAKAISVEKLTLKEAYDLYQQLHRYFGPKPTAL